MPLARLFSALSQDCCRLARDRGGVTRVEYGVMASLAMVAGLAEFLPILRTLSGTFSALQTALQVIPG